MLENSKVGLKQIPHLPEENIIIEPFGRDTAAAVGLAAAILERKGPYEVMIVLPADHYIRDVSRFMDVLKGAVTAAERGKDIVTLGITPHRPETGYGYICLGEMFDTFNGIQAYHVVRFLEKPEYARALEFISSRRYLWNSGMFIWRVDLIGKLIETHAPRLAEGLNVIREGFGADGYNEILKQVYLRLPKISVDYSILERADNVLVMPGEFGWDDIGSWTALERYTDKDGNGNVLKGQGVFLNTSNTFVYSPEKTVAIMNVENLIVVNGHDSLLICHKNSAQDIKKAVQAIRDKGFIELL